MFMQKFVNSKIRICVECGSTQVIQNQTSITCRDCGDIFIKINKKIAQRLVLAEWKMNHSTCGTYLRVLYITKGKKWVQLSNRLFCEKCDKIVKTTQEDSGEWLEQVTSRLFFKLSSWGFWEMPTFNKKSLISI